MSTTTDRFLRKEDSPYSKMRGSVKQLISFAPLESAVDMIISLLEGHEQTLAKHTNDLKMIGVVESRASALASRVHELEKGLRRKDDEITQLNLQLDNVLRSETSLRLRLEKVEQDFSFFRSSRDTRDHEIGELRVLVKLAEDKAEQADRKIDKTLSDIDDIRTTQSWMQDGQLAGRIIKLERDIHTKVDSSRLSTELEMRDNLRKEMIDTIDGTLRRVERHETLVEKLSTEVLAKCTASDLRTVETRVSAKAEKEDVNEIRRVLRSLEEDYKKKTTNLEEKKAPSDLVKQMDSRLATNEGEMKAVREGVRMIQDYIMKISSSLNTYASDTKLQALAKTVEDLEQRNLQAEIKVINHRLEDKADKESVKQLHELINSIFFDDGNGAVVARTHYRCLMCNRLAPSMKDGHTCRQEDVAARCIFASKLLTNIQLPHIKS
eukprot:TRINITY_DN6899_c0_g1_i3.p1 TRINITY_DN6899_c0_g1~~TRINITY_DN6899_c0_g1_i3.p1  ORF type:complete len:437 (-),score=107.44 TRINITY_DN6899_c0_g1_i3:129-1439(-)